MSVVKVEGKYENGILKISLEGRIDSSNASDTEKQIFDLVADSTPTTAEIDVAKLEYISSAGLRILLKLKKQGPSVTVINASSDVYEIFDVTGFTSILEVRKAFRQVGIDGCKEIGRGAYGTVYQLTEDSIVKVYRIPGANSLDIIKREQETARKAFVYGMPTAISYDIVKVGDDMGVVYEMLDAQTLGAYVTEHPEEFEQRIQQMAELAKNIHSTVVKNGEFQDIKEFLVNEFTEHVRGWVTEEQFKQILSTIEAVPNHPTLLHGDFHTKNILIRNGELELIDMGDVRTGHPIFEFSSLCMLQTLFNTRPETKPWLYAGTDEETGKKIWPAVIKFYLGDKYTPETAELFIKATQIAMLIKLLPQVALRINAVPNPTPEEKMFVTSRVDALLGVKPEAVAGLFQQVDALIFN